MKNYAIILKFDKKSENQIQKLINKINEKLSTNYSTPPHITLGVFQTDDLSRYASNFDDYAKELINGQVTFASIGQFVPKVIYLAPIMNEVLLHNHDVVRKMIYSSDLTDENPQNHEYYLKNQWQPHCTLAMDLDEKKLITAIKIILKYFKPITAKIKSVLLVEADPYLELPEYTKNIKSKKTKVKLNPYSVKVISKIIVEGKPDFKDENYSDDTNHFEEQVLLFNAKSFDHAFDKAEKYMNKQVRFPSHKNIYGQTVRVEVLEYVSSYHLFEEPSMEDPEVFSSIFSVPKSISDEEVLVNRYDYYIKDKEQSKYDEWETLKRKVILNAEFQNKR